MINLKKLVSQFDRINNQVFRIWSLWIFGDVIYAVLPLIVLLIIYKLLHKPFDNFLVLKEWSFASIVLYGAMIRKFVRVKVLLQQNPRSFKLDVGVQFFIILLIASVLVLALAILAEEHVLPENILDGLGHAQITLFLIALISLLVGTVVEDDGILWAQNSKSNIQGAKLLFANLMRRIDWLSMYCRH
jgi:TRAP-type C4-dicarboxylate transport system permease large subunit